MKRKSARFASFVFIARFVTLSVLSIGILCSHALAIHLEGSLGQADTMPGSQSPQDTDKQLMRFVNRNHPELKPLLNYLRQNRPESYQDALAQIKKSVERIEAIKERDPERYEVELEIWKLQSRKRIIAARITVAQKNTRARKKDPEKLDASIETMQEELNATIREELEARARRAELDIERSKRRMETLKKQIKVLRGIDDERIERMARAELAKLKSNVDQGKQKSQTKPNSSNDKNTKDQDSKSDKRARDKKTKNTKNKKNNDKAKQSANDILPATSGGE